MTDVVTAPEAAPSHRRVRGGALRYVLTKLGGAVISLLLVVVLGFFLFRVLPGDPARTLTRDRPVSNDQLAALRHQLGLDQSLLSQFWHYLTGLLHGDLGTSYEYKQPVIHMIAGRIWPTILLTGTATVLAAALGLWLGTRAAWKHGSAGDKATTGIALVFWSMPTFWLALILLIVFGAGLGPIPGLFPTAGMATPGGVGGGFIGHVGDVLHHLVLPCVTLIAVIYAQYVMVMRASLIEEMGADYLTTARAKGLREDLVRRRHAVPNALLPTVTLIFLNLGFVVSGAVTVETVFTWPGLGYLTFQALDHNDLPLLQGSMIVLAGAVIVMNLLADLLYRVLDPRVRTA